MAPGRTMMVQDLAGALATPDLPTQYVVRAHDKQQLALAAMAPVPVIDLGLLSMENGAGDEATKLRSTLECWGIIMVSNHGVDAAVTDGLRAALKEFFRRPAEERKRPSNLNGGVGYHQVEGYGNDRVSSPDQILDWSDRIYIKVEPHDEQCNAAWPPNSDTLREALQEFAKGCGEMKDRLLREMAKLLELDDNDYFVDQLGERAPTHTRCSYYPKCPRPELVFGLKPHSDGTVVTVVMVDETVGGLQVLREGVWWDVPVVPNTLMAIIGDQIQIMSNGIFKAPWHRVLTNASKERISAALDFSVHHEREIEPCAQLVNEKRPALYRKVMVKDYLAGLYDRFTQGKRTIDSVLI